jgi:tRNA(fMet)-specific endonuclease VapC
MGRRLILNTNVLIGYERGSLDRSAFDEDDLAVAALSIAEYRVGIELADSVARARALVAITSAVDVLPYTEGTAAHHARLLAHVRRSGTPRGAHDLIVAAHALETDRIVVSRDAAAHFSDLPGVAAVQV